MGLHVPLLGRTQQPRRCGSGFLPRLPGILMIAVACRVFVSPNHHPARSAAPRRVAVLRVVLQLPSCNHFWTTLNDQPPCVGQPWNPPGIRLESARNPVHWIDSWSGFMSRFTVRDHGRIPITDVIGPAGGQNTHKLLQPSIYAHIIIGN